MIFEWLIEEEHMIDELLFYINPTGYRALSFLFENKSQQSLEALLLSNSICIYYFGR